MAGSVGAKNPDGGHGQQAGVSLATFAEFEGRSLPVADVREGSHIADRLTRGIPLHHHPHIHPRDSPIGVGAVAMIA